VVPGPPVRLRLPCQNGVYPAACCQALLAPLPCHAWAPCRLRQRVDRLEPRAPLARPPFFFPYHAVSQPPFLSPVSPRSTQSPSHHTLVELSHNVVAILAGQAPRASPPRPATQKSSSASTVWSLAEPAVPEFRQCRACRSYQWAATPLDDAWVPSPSITAIFWSTS
jgi:hypothetical protein